MVAIHSWKYALIAASAGLGGCAGGLNNGAPPVVRLENGIMANNSNEALSVVRTAIQADCLDVEAPKAAEAAKVNRNRLVMAYMFGIDLSYNEYERNLLDAVRQNDLGASSASMALSTIGSVIGNPALAQALSATNAIVTGTHTAIGRDYLINQTMTTLQTQMRANRANQRALIVRRRNLDYVDWDSCMALSDVLAYEQAGTLNGAIAAVAANAADANRQGEQQARDAIQRVTQARDPLSLALQAYLAPSDAALRRTRREAARSMIEEEGLLTTPPMVPAERLSRILNDGEWSRERLVLARRLITRDAAGTTAVVAALPQ